jgi:hypothetical protein
MYTAS